MTGINNTQDVAYDSVGRMKYHPDFHCRQGTPWTTTDQNYLIDNYDSLGMKNISMALERTETSVAARAWELRKSGLMKKYQARFKNGN